MEKKTLKKILVIAIVFILTFSNYGFTLQAIATSEGISFLGFNLFGSNKLGFNAYFLDGDGKKHESNVVDVNDEMTLIVELEPKEEGYLKNGTIKAIAEEGEANFEILEVIAEEEEQDTLTQVVASEETLLKTEQTVNTTENEENTVDTNTVSNDVADENTTDENTALENITNNIVETPEEKVEEQEELVDEEAVVNEKIEEEKEEVEIIKNAAQATIVSGTEIAVENVIEPTKLYIKLQFKSGEKLDVSDVYKKINLEFVGTYINVDLEEIEVTAQSNLEIGWSYSKDIEVSSEYTKVSPFEVGDTKGTIIENRVVVKREIEDEKYLPLKQTKIEIEVPEVNGKKPMAMEISANKLKATRGEEINEVVFTNENWEYDERTNVLTITVENTDVNYTYGEDIYVITYRYEDYVQSNEINLKTNGKVTVEEYSGKENNIVSKDINKEQKVQVNIGELITYSIGTTEEKINRGRINANYNSEQAVYETAFTTTVNINVLTNDILNEFTLKNTREFYIDKQNLEFETQDVKYKKIRLKYEEIAELLEKGGTIEIKSNSGELLYTLNSELIKSQENCEIEIRGEVTGVEITFKNISVNGNITVDFEKAIGKCSFDKSAFNSFEKIESRIKAEVKYSEEEEITELKEIKTQKYFKDSFTSAEMSISKDALSTINNNENVEIKIELNNHLEGSDLYSNPVFEVVFPEYVKNVEAKTTNLLYEDELKVKNTTVFTDNGVVKMQIALEGTQTRFSEGRLTHGTNIIINTNIDVDDYTPRKEDQIRMYYYNEGVTNYEAQTKWTVKANIPTGILKTTNGFDVDVFSYQTPSGFVTINEIQNYDGQNNKVTSVKQGEELREVAMEKEAQVVTMNLIAMNNTENDCTDVTLLGRIPTKEATDVKTGDSLGNNIDTIMTSLIVADEYNPVSSKIYYSSNVNATKNISDEGNGWTETPENLSEIKSFLIVPTEKIETGTIYKYSYQFEIPANLPYESKMYGSFGAFYNNHSDVAVIYEATTADKVGLFTKNGPKVEAKLSVDIGDGTEVGEAKFLNYTLEIINSGSVTAENIIITNPIPENTVLYEKEVDANIGVYGWFQNEDTSTLTWNIDALQPGEQKTYTYTVKTPEMSDIKDSEDLTIKNKATIQVENLALEIESNETNNKLKKSNFDINIYSMNEEKVSVGNIFNLTVNAENITGETLNNVVLEYQIPKELAFNRFTGTLSEQQSTLEDAQYNYNSENNLFKIQIEKWLPNEILNISIFSELVSGNVNKVENDIKLITEDGTEEISQSIDMIFKGPAFEIVQICSATDNTVVEGENIEFITVIKNNGNAEALNTTICTEISENLVDAKAQLTGVANTSVDIEDGYVDYVHYSIPAGETLNFTVSGKAKDVDDDNSIINSKVLVINDYVQNFEANEFNIKIKNDPNRVIEEEEDTYEPDYIIDTNPSQNETPKDDEEVENPDDATINNNDNSNNEDTQNNTNVEQNNNTQNDEQQKQEEKQEEKKYSITGKVWLDLDKNGNMDSGEAGISGVQVQLQNENTMIKATATSKEGVFKFEDLLPGNYIVIYNYDDNLYNPTTYKATENREDITSSAREISSGKAVTNTILVANADIANVNLGLQNKDKSNLTVSKYITSAIVKTAKNETVHKYENLDLAKMEIAAKEVNGSVVDLNYTIVIKNEGNVDAKAVQVIDYLPKDTILKEDDGWYLGTDGNAYNDTLKDIIIAPGETRSLNISLIRNMTDENTGVISNKVEIKTENDKGLKEETKDNYSTQEVIISIKTGYVAQISISIIIVIGAVMIVYLVTMKKIKINLKKFRINRIYK